MVIEDNGIGILPEELPRIFEKFYQAKSSTKISSPGTGIGLSLTKALVELHQGTITAESVPDSATVFTILLPIDANAYQQEENLVTPPDVVHMGTQPDDIIAPPDQEVPDPGTAGEKPKILVVEDNTELRDYLVAELRMEFSVLEAPNGADGPSATLLC